MSPIVLDKNKVNELISGKRKEVKKPEIIQDNLEEYSAHLSTPKKQEPLTVVICNEVSEIIYDKLRTVDNHVLICSDIRYLNSVNHLDNVKEILLDYASFTDANEVAFLVHVFQLLHRNADIVISYNEALELLKLQKLLEDVNNVYLIEQTCISESFMKYIVPLHKSKDKLSVKRKRFHCGQKIKYLIVGIISIMVIGAIVTTTYFYFFSTTSNQEVYNRNMNVQLDMDTSTILPIEKVYSDDKGNHIIIEEITKEGTENLNIGLYNQNQQKVAADLQKITCPESKCTNHYELIFSKNSEIKYYILQLEKTSVTKNIEIDQLYFE